MSSLKSAPVKPNVQPVKINGEKNLEKKVGREKSKKNEEKCP